MEIKDYTIEKNKLYEYLGTSIVDLFKENKVFIAEGCITSIFCNKAINDVDIYLRNNKFLKEVITGIGGGSVYLTKKACLIPRKPQQYQIIHYKFFNTAQEIFDAFDFTVCMGVFDFADEKFYLHDNFLLNNLQKTLHFNPKTSYPIVSLLRTKKYIDKGYQISTPQLISIILTCRNTKIESWDELKNQIGGMYEEEVDNIFDEKEPYSMNKAIEQIINLKFDSIKEIDWKYHDYQELIDIISKENSLLFDYKDDKFLISPSGRCKKITDISTITVPYKQITENELIDHLLPERIAYKHVKKVENKYFSFYKNTFEYVIGKETIGTESLYFYRLSNLNKGMYSTNKDAVVIKCFLTNVDPFSLLGDNIIKCKSCIPLKEVSITKEDVKTSVDIEDFFS